LSAAFSASFAAWVGERRRRRRRRTGMKTERKTGVMVLRR
jgi:hypothetical protein